MKLLRFSLILLVLLALWSACMDIDLGSPTKTAGVTFAGQIIDENGQPLSGAVVRAGNQLTTTDLNGVFRLPATRLAADDARLHVRKAGYFEFSRAYIVEEEALQTVTIQLIAKTQVGSIPAAQGGLVQVPGGPTLTFPANGVMTAGGGAYNGTVLVYAAFLDPSAPDLGLRMPGDLRGISAGGEAQALATFGMLAVEISGTGGEALQIATGSEVEITMPIAASQSSAPTSIPLWHFDLEKARWIEEGAAQQVGNQYVGKVKHFSFWNCDDPYDLVILHGKVFVGDDQHPLSNASIRIETAGLGSGYGYTDNDGNFGGAVPKGVPLTLEVVHLYINSPCSINQATYSQNIGPFDSDVTLPPIIVSTPQVQDNTITIEGRLLDCNQQPIDNGYAKIVLTNGQSFIAFTTADGVFQSSFVHCGGGSLTGQVIAYDLTNYLESTAQTVALSVGTTQLGNLAVCNALAEFIQYKLDGQDLTLFSPSFYSDGLTYINAYNPAQNNQRIALSFNSNQQPGTFPLIGLSVNQFSTDSSGISINVTTTVSAFGNVGEPIIGTFDGAFPDWTGANHSISGSYRVIRQ